MAIFNLGSINADNVYQVPHLPCPGETVFALGLTQGLGGKGANMSVAAVRAAARVVHIGAVGPDGAWAKHRLTEYGVSTRYVMSVSNLTGHANIYVDSSGENSIIVFPGANHQLSIADVCSAVNEASPGDYFVLQNETNGQVPAAKLAREQGLRIVYSAAPFDLRATAEIVGLVDLLVLNSVEATQLMEGFGSNLGDLPISDIIVTSGSTGCIWISKDNRQGQHFEAAKVQAVDTTGAGDTFTGYLVAGLDRGMSMPDAICLATRAAALMVTRGGTADVIPDLKEIQDHFG